MSKREGRGVHGLRNVDDTRVVLVVAYAFRDESGVRLSGLFHFCVTSCFCGNVHKESVHVLTDFGRVGYDLVVDSYHYVVSVVSAFVREKWLYGGPEVCAVGPCRAFVVEVCLYGFASDADC